MKARFDLTEEDIKNTFMERWGPRVQQFYSDGPAEGRKLRISDIWIRSSGGTVEFTDEPEEQEAASEPPPPPPAASAAAEVKEFDDDIPF